MKKLILALVVLTSALAAKADEHGELKTKIQAALAAQPNLPYIVQILDTNPENVNASLIDTGSTNDEDSSRVLSGLAEMFKYSIGERSDNPSPDTYQGRGQVVCSETAFDSDHVQCVLSLIDINGTRVEFTSVAEVDSEGKFINLTGVLTLTLYGNSNQPAE